MGYPALCLAIKPVHSSVANSTHGHDVKCEKWYNMSLHEAVETKISKNHNHLDIIDY